jgi:hypothetical protein
VDPVELAGFVCSVPVCPFVSAGGGWPVTPPVSAGVCPVSELELPLSELELPLSELELPLSELELPLSELELPLSDESVEPELPSPSLSSFEKAT